MKLLCAADPSNGHHYRYLHLLGRAGLEIHLLDHGVRRRTALPLAGHQGWPRSGRRVFSALLGHRLGFRLAHWHLRRSLQRIWRRSRADVCHVHWIDERAWHVAKAGLHPLVLTAYGSDLNWTRLPDHDPVLRARKSAALAGCDLLIADSEDVIALASDLAGRPLRSLLLPIGIDTSLFCPGYAPEAGAWRARLDLPSTATVFLSPRIMHGNYGHDVILRAFSIALRRMNGYLVFKAHWSDPSYVEGIRGLARELGISNRIRVIEGVLYGELPGLYAMADCAVNFPVMDAFPVTFLECAASGLPIISNHLPAYDSNGMDSHLTFAEPSTAEALSETMVQFAAAPRAHARIDAARAHVVKNFDETRFVHQLLSAFQDLTVARRS